MSKISATNTKPERIVRQMLHMLGYRFRLHKKDLPGKPDIVLPRHRAVIFVHGCFWHHHKGCKKSAFPATNVKFWKSKILRNIERDKQAFTALKRTGWRVLAIWECETKDMKFGKKLSKFLAQKSDLLQRESVARTKYRLRDSQERKNR